MYMTVKTMNKKIPKFNANIGEEFDQQSVLLKKRNTNYAVTFIALLFLGAGFVDLGLREELPLAFGLVFTTLALVVYIIKDLKNTNEQWTYTRIAAESIKSEWFKYIVGGGDYPCNKKVGEEYYENLLVKNINEKIAEYRTNIINVNGKPIEYSVVIDHETKSIRNYDFAERLNIYKTARIQDQLNWYEKKKVLMQRRDKMFKTAFYAIVIFGIVAGILRYIGLESSNIYFIGGSDWFSIAVALGFTLENVKKDFQYERLTINYNKSASDLRESLRKIDDLENDISKDENVFSEFVEDVENRISSEHKSWSLTTSSKNIADF
jgi:hypothetical protein